MLNILLVRLQVAKVLCIRILSAKQRVKVLIKDLSTPTSDNNCGVFRLCISLKLVMILGQFFFLSTMYKSFIMVLKLLDT